MGEYRLTSRGKVVLSIFILVLVVLIYSSGKYIMTYYFDHLDTNVTLLPTSEQVETTEVTTEETKETTETTETTETNKMDDKIYTILELDDLKQFKMIIYFDEVSDTVNLSQSELESIEAILELYPNEKISILGHVNGYPNYTTNKVDDDLSLNRALFIKNIFLNLGFEPSLINVYSFGSEKPLYKDYGNQDKNNRVEIYFEDHFVNGDGGK